MPEDLNIWHQNSGRRVTANFPRRIVDDQAMAREPNANDTFLA
jgi:hypothetical protein